MSDNELTRNQTKALAALLACSTVKAAAEQADLTERTLYRYLNDETFKSELRKRQGQVLAAATAAMAGGGGDALAVLREVMSDPAASEATRVRAALGWLQTTRQQLDLLDILERVEKLEVMIDEQRN